MAWDEEATTTTTTTNARHGTHPTESIVGEQYLTAISHKTCVAVTNTGPYHNIINHRRGEYNSWSINRGVPLRAIWNAWNSNVPIVTCHGGGEELAVVVVVALITKEK